MSARRARRRTDEPRPLRTEGLPVTESWPDGDWVVRAVTGQSAQKSYRCPGCDHDVVPGTAHLVVWRAGEQDLRRHWHRPCWQARLRRPGPRGQM